MLNKILSSESLFPVLTLSSNYRNKIIVILHILILNRGNRATGSHLLESFNK